MLQNLIVPDNIFDALLCLDKMMASHVGIYLLNILQIMTII